DLAIRRATPRADLRSAVRSGPPGPVATVVRNGGRRLDRAVGRADRDPGLRVGELAGGPRRDRLPPLLRREPAGVRPRAGPGGLRHDAPADPRSGRWLARDRAADRPRRRAVRPTGVSGTTPGA